MRKTAFLLVLAGTGAPGRVLAQDTEKACFAAAEGGQRARQLGKLTEARAVLTRCATSSCPTAVSDDCTRWIADIDEAMPSVVVVPQDAAGNDLPRGVVTIDGQPTDVLKAEPTTVEPGTHRVVLDAPGGHAEQVIVVREHEKNRRVILRLPAPPPPPPPPRRPTSLPWVLGGTALFFGAAFGAFATAGYLDRQSSHCDEGCASGDYTRVRAELVTADAAAGVAVVLLVTAIIDYAVTRGHHTDRAATTPWLLWF